MMTETQRRIRAYKKALPELRERVIAVALLLAMSASMLTSASFAWLTISRRPEVTGVSTTVAANGNLEIALVEPEGKKPADSAVGDSSAAEGQSVTAANITWGNLVNLSDPSYGLENLTLRPAQLNTAALLTSPLYGAVYNPDGRITQLTSNFGYATWNLPEGDKPGYFGVAEAGEEIYGVRAISSTKIEAVGAEALYVKMVANATDTNAMAASTYKGLGNNDRYMPSLATMMGLFMTARMNPDDASLSNPTCNIEDIQNLRDMYADFLECFDMEAEAIAALANLQLFLLHGEGNYTPYTAEGIYGTTTDGLKAEGIQVTNLDQFKKDRNTIASDLENLNTLCASGTSLKWKDSGLNTIVNNLVDVGKCTIGADNTPISSIGASNAMGYLSGPQEARITNGILYRFEERTGGYIEVKNLSISATVKRSGITVPASVKANIQTTAPRDYNLFSNDLAFAQSLNTGNYQGGIPVAQDTYGLAIDLWVRTNAEGSYLTLEGNVLTQTDDVQVTGKDANGNTVDIYTFIQTVETEDGSTLSNNVDVYKVTAEDDTVTWYNATSHTALTEEDLGGATPKLKIEQVQTVIGFEGENRVWGDKDTLSTDSTTQGSGSCYVYYADTPEDQARSLKLLEAFNVAFVNDQGKLMAKATMDTARYHAENGRVIVPLVLSPSDSVNLGEDYQGNVTYGITALEKNTATRITAIVFLDGTKLTNQDVLSAADIQGQLNIQFGSTADMSVIDNEKLESEERRVSATVDVTSFDYDTATGPMTTNVTVHVDGTEPSTVTAFFMRAISATQGSREEVMTFTKNDSGDWVSSYTFTAPGNYILRTVRLDGVDYDLATPPEVVINGFTVESLSCDGATNNHVNILTAAGSSTVNMNLKFATDDVTKMPKTVQGRFLNDEDGSAVNINFTYNPTSGLWTGSATFLTSGEYSMQYLVLDGEYVELDSALYQTASVTLGMRVAVYTTSPHTFKYAPSEMKDNEKELAMQVKIMDNAGNEMRGMSGVKLTYGMKGSGIKKLDTDLTWNGSYYVGNLTPTGPGIWQFSQVVVGSNTLTNATTYPTFTIQSPEPPEYYDHGTVAYQYKPNNDATMNVQITNSAAATVQAYIIKDGAAEGTWVDGVIGGDFTTSDGTAVNNWSFAVPKDANGYQDGNWKLTELRLWDVFAADGTEYTEESPLILELPENANNVTKVVNRINVNFAEGQSKDFSGVFMQGHPISGLNVDIKDFENNTTTVISDVQLKLTYEEGTSGTYGGYTSDSLTSATEGATITIPLTADSTGTHFVQTSDANATILYAGKYTTEFSFKVNGTTVTYSGDKLLPNTPKFTVSSVTPAVKITSAYYASADSDSQSTFSDTSTTVYYRKTVQSVNICGVTTNYNKYEQAKVAITLSGYGNASGAQLEFTTSNADGVVHLYEENQKDAGTSTNMYTWTGNGACLRYMGWWESNTGNDEKAPAGTLTATTLIFTYGGNQYSIDISDITIKNPS